MTKKVLYDYIVKPLDESPDFFNMVNVIGDDPFRGRNIWLLEKSLKNIITLAKDKTKLPDNIKSSPEKFA